MEFAGSVPSVFGYKQRIRLFTPFSKFLHEILSTFSTFFQAFIINFSSTTERIEHNKYEAVPGTCSTITLLDKM